MEDQKRDNGGKKERERGELEKTMGKLGMRIV